VDKNLLNFSLITVNRVRAIVLDLDPLMLKEKHDQLYIFFPFLTCIKIIWIHFNLKVLNSSNMREKRGTRENLNFFFFLNIHGCMEKPRNIYTREESWKGGRLNGCHAFSPVSSSIKLSKWVTALTLALA
jgi:hypothetical protein